MSRNAGFTISILYIKPIFLFIKTYFIYLKNKIYFLKKCHIVDSFIWGTFLLFFFFLLLFFFFINPRIGCMTTTKYMIMDEMFCLQQYAFCSQKAFLTKSFASFIVSIFVSPYVFGDE